MKSGVYEIINQIDGRRYVGSAVDLSKRKTDHFSSLRRGLHRNKRLQTAFDELGASVFEFIVILSCDASDLIVEEQRRIDLYSRDMLYNAVLFAGSVAGLKWSKDSRSRQSERQRGRRPSPETCFLRAQANTGMKRSLEARRRMSEVRAASAVGNTNRAKGYPALYDPSGHLHPGGRNLAAFCREHGLRPSLMYSVVDGRRPHHKGWTISPKPPT